LHFIPAAELGGIAGGTSEICENARKCSLTPSLFGFRDQDFLKLRLYSLHEAKFKFVD